MTNPGQARGIGPARVALYADVGGNNPRTQTTTTEPVAQTPPSEDSKLVALALHGNKDAFRILVERHQDAVYDLCLRMLGSRQDAEDVTQETFLALYRHLGDYRSEHKLSNWLYTIALNRCRRLLRKRKILRFLSLDFSGEEGADAGAPEVAAEEPLPEAGLEQADAERWTARLLESLPENLREPFLLRYLKKMSYGEIASSLGLSLANVKVRLHRAKLALWKKFGKAPKDL